MNDEIKTTLFDITQSIEDIESFVEGMEFPDFQVDRKTQRAVEREFEIIGEALIRIRRKAPELLDPITDHQQIIGFRNVIAHGYDVLDEEIVWDAVQKHMPVLKTDVKSML